jgi:hypothetical protein
VSPERLRPARFSTLRSSEAARVPCYVRARSLAPFRPMRSSPSVTRARRAVLPAAASVRLSAPLGRGEKMLLTDLCNRPTTRAPDGPFDFRAPWLAPPQITECFVGVSRLLPRDAGPPCGNPAPARTRLTARRRASKALAASFQDASRRWRRSTSSGDRHLRCRSPPCAGLFGRSAGSTSVSLTPFVARRHAPPLSRRRLNVGPDSTPPSARQCDRLARIRAPSIDECSRARAFARRFL